MPPDPLEVSPPAGLGRSTSGASLETEKRVKGAGKWGEEVGRKDPPVTPSYFDTKYCQYYTNDLGLGLGKTPLAY